MKFDIRARNRLDCHTIGVASRNLEKGIAMLNDLQDSQTIIVYDATGIIYIGKVGYIPEGVREQLACADFYLLDSCEEYDVVAIC